MKEVQQPDNQWKIQEKKREERGKYLSEPYRNKKVTCLITSNENCKKAEEHYHKHLFSLALDDDDDYYMLTSCTHIYQIIIKNTDQLKIKTCSLVEERHVTPYKYIKS